MQRAKIRLAIYERLGVPPRERIAIGLGAHRLGMSIEDYFNHKAMGEKWCYFCRRWHGLRDFDKSRKRRDGIKGICRTGAKVYEYQGFRRAA